MQIASILRFFMFISEKLLLSLPCKMAIIMEVTRMKKILFTLILTVLTLTAQAADIKPVSNAFKIGNADMLKEMVAAEVDIVAPGVSKKGSGADAIAILKSFFQNNKPTDFTVAHHADKNDSGFIVGKLVTANREFRVNITYTAKDGKILITIIRIE